MLLQPYFILWMVCFGVIEEANASIRWIQVVLRSGELLVLLIRITLVAMRASGYLFPF